MDNVAFFFHMLGVLLFVSGMVLAGAAFDTPCRAQLVAATSATATSTKIEGRIQE